MFDGVPDQFHQFMASRTSLPIPPSFPLHHGSSPSFPSFDPFPSSHHQTLHHQLPHHLLHPQLHHHQAPRNKNESKPEAESSLLSANSELRRERSIPETLDPWSSDEVLALLRTRSSMENWFPDFTWEHISRKLAELGFKRSSEKCKEKFEEESRNFNSIINYNKNCRFFSELEDVCHGENSEVSAKKDPSREKPHEEEGQKLRHGLEEEEEEEDSRNVREENHPTGENEEVVKEAKKCKKRKRKQQQKFEVFMGFCEAIVNRMMAQQEELHNRLLESMARREEEKIAREEAWKRQEMERINKEIEIRAREQAIAGDRQAIIIEFLKKLSSSISDETQSFAKRIEDLQKTPSSSNSPISHPSCPPENPSSTSLKITQNKVLLEAATSTSSTMVVAHHNPSSLPAQSNNPNTPTSSTETLSPQMPTSTLANSIPKAPTSSTLHQPPQNPSSTSISIQNNPLHPTPSSANKPLQNPNSSAPNEREDIGKRWPRDEVLALINLRCNLYNSNVEEKEGGTKGPLWERISQGMLELGYRRSAKRCKEKWENINKYFRKTKDVNKKRSPDSRTCPYFHQLSSLYSQGTLVVPSSDDQENCPNSTKNRSDTPETTLGSSPGNACT